LTLHERHASRPQWGGDSFLAVSNPAAHPALLATHLATTFTAATTSHAFSSTGVDISTIWDSTTVRVERENHES
jgi:hypothetical protein